MSFDIMSFDSKNRRKRVRVMGERKAGKPGRRKRVGTAGRMQNPEKRGQIWRTTESSSRWNPLLKGMLILLRLRVCTWFWGRVCCFLTIPEHLQLGQSTSHLTGG
jgi:hypothetical protein